jgi:leader peptidase (prepilin peptidase) / N-methyltransferase
MARCAGAPRLAVDHEEAIRVQPIAIGTGIVFALLGAAAERLAVQWPAEEASHRRPGLRTAVMALATGLAAGAIVARSTLPWWATAVYLVVLGILAVLTATDWEQRRLPHLALDPLILLAAAFVPFNPAVEPLWALVGAVSAAGFLWIVGLVVRGGVALGDLYLVAPLGLLLGWPAIFAAVFIAAILAALASVLLLVSGRAAMKTYIPFGPFLVIGALVTLLREPELLGALAAATRFLL